MTAKLILRTNPIRTMSRCCIWPELNTIAFGGVAIGSMNAQEAAKVSGKIISLGGSPISMATAAKIGTRRAVLAVLLESSVKKITKVTITPMKSKGGHPAIRV